MSGPLKTQVCKVHWFLSPALHLNCSRSVCVASVDRPLTLTLRPLVLTVTVCLCPSCMEVSSTHLYIPSEQLQCGWHELRFIVSRMWPALLLSLRSIWTLYYGCKNTILHNIPSFKIGCIKVIQNLSTISKISPYANNRVVPVNNVLSDESQVA